MPNESLGNESTHDSRVRASEINYEGCVTMSKELGMVKLQYVNWNDFGPRINNTMDQLIKCRTKKDVDNVLVSSSDTRWTTKNEHSMINMLRRIKLTVTLNASDSREKFNSKRKFLKWGNVTSAMNDVAGLLKSKARINII